MYLRKIVITSASALALVLAGTAAGAAMTASTSDPVYYACVHGTTFRYDAGAAKCPLGYTKIHWDQTGPAGPRGAAGPAGSTGPAGATGPSTAGPGGLDVIAVCPCPWRL